MQPSPTARYADWLVWIERQYVYRLVASLPCSLLCDELPHQPDFPTLATLMSDFTMYETHPETRLSFTPVTTGLSVDSLLPATPSWTATPFVLIVTLHSAANTENLILVL